MISSYEWLEGWRNFRYPISPTNDNGVISELLLDDLVIAAKRMGEMSGAIFFHAVCKAAVEKFGSSVYGQFVDLREE